MHSSPDALLIRCKAELTYYRDGWKTAHGFRHLVQSENPDPKSCANRRVDYGVKTNKYLKLTLDSEMSLLEQIKATADKAAAWGSGWSRLRANVGGPTFSRKRLLISATQSILICGAEVYADAFGKEYNRGLVQVQRYRALLVVSAYRTVSESAVNAIVTRPRGSSSLSLVNGVTTTEERED